MNNTTLNVRVNASDKKSFEKFCDNVGMNVSTAINMFIKSVLREQKLPFEIKSDEYEKYVYAKLKEAEKELESNSKRYSLEEVNESVRKKLQARK